MNKRVIWLLHAVFWLVLLALLTYRVYRLGTSSWSRELVYTGVFGLANISAFYINLLVGLPRFLRPRRFWWLPLWWAALIAGYAILKNYLNIALTPYVPHGYRMYIGLAATLRQSIYIIGFFLFISTVYKLAEDWLMHEKIRNRLEKENLRSELLFLRSQINPHFLFNTLNNIYSLAYQKSDLAPGAIAGLSAMMRYMLSERQDNLVPLKTELQYLQNFIDLQALRVKNGLEMDTEISGDTDHYAIAPLLLINFLENTFKHGILNDPTSPIILRVSVKNERLRFYLSNRVHHGGSEVQEGIGMRNVQRRLDLLYPRRHTLKTLQKDDRYIVELRLSAKAVSPKPAA